MKNILVSACFLGVNCRYNGVTKENHEVLKLLEKEDIRLIPVCPEQLGGLATPRLPSERQGDLVVNQTGADVTENYQRGAEEALRIAKLYHCEAALLKERSPSCGSGEIYDGSFTKTLIQGDGVTAELLKKHGIRILGESRIKEL